MSIFAVEKMKNIVYYEKDKITKMVPNNLNVDVCNDLIIKLKEILGEDNIKSIV